MRKSTKNKNAAIIRNLKGHKKTIETFISAYKNPDEIYSIMRKCITPSEIENLEKLAISFNNVIKYYTPLTQLTFKKNPRPSAKSA